MITNVLLGILILVVIILIFKVKNNKDNYKEVEKAIEKSNINLSRALNENINSNQRLFNEMLGEKIGYIEKGILKSQAVLRESVTSSLRLQEDRFKTFSLENEQKLENIRKTVENSLSSMQKDNNLKLEQMRGVVEEKLQQSIEEKMNRSFALVSERLEQVYKGLGEMQNLATGVGDLKRVLTNVKARGILGELQLGAILSEILSKEQYDENVEVVPGSNKRVEFAIKLPSDDNSKIYLPIDSKFPADRYQNLLDAYDTGDKDKISLAEKELLNVIELEAKEISEKYIYPPYTTNFAIMFLPFESLYSEVVAKGMIEKLQNKYHINIAGPSTMASLLNSLQMGFKTLAIQKRSMEVWTTLAAVKTEFSRFADALNKTRKHLDQASSDLDALVTTRTNAINRKLREVETLKDGSYSKSLLEDFGYEE